MRHRARLLDTLHRAETGPLIDEKEFDNRIITPTVTRLLKKYGIKNDTSAVVSYNDDMADRIFQAGLELAAEVGIFCQSTSRRMIWTIDELKDSIRTCPSQAILGKDGDTAIVNARQPEDGKVPIIAGGPYGILTNEELFIPLMLSYAQESVIDAIDPPTLETAYGYPIKSSSPWEIEAGWRELELSMEVLNRVGRHGLSLGCVGLATTDIAELSVSSYGGYRPTDRHYVGMLSEFKTNYHMLNRIVHVTRIGGLIQAFYNPIFGGYVGGAEGVAIAMVAGPILLNQAYMATGFGARPQHPILNCNTTRDLLWAMSIALQGLARNTNLLIHALAGPAGGPGTKTMLLENAALSITVTVSGVSMIACSMSAGGVQPGHASGLDAKICGEVARAIGTIKRDEANYIVERLVSLYEPQLSSKPIGMPFDQVYDLNTLLPKPEWLETYQQVKENISRFGLKI